MIAFDIADDGGAGGRDVLAPVGFGNESGVGGRDEVRTEGDFVHRVKAQCTHQPDELVRIDVGELGRKTGSDTSCDTSAGPQQGTNGRDGTDRLLRVLGTHFDAVATGNTAFGDDARLAVLDANGLGRTLPHARVAHAAAFRNGVDKGGGHVGVLRRANRTLW